MAITFNKENLLLFKSRLETYESKESAVLPTLALAQKQFGYLSDEVIKYVAQLLEMPEARVLEVVSFYSMFRTKPTAKIEIAFCSNLTCQMKGMEALKHYARERAREIARMRGEGLVEVIEVACLGSCDQGPAIMVNRERQVGGVTKEALEQIFAQLPG